MCKISVIREFSKPTRIIIKWRNGHAADTRWIGLVVKDPNKKRVTWTLGKPVWLLFKVFAEDQTSFID